MHWPWIHWPWIHWIWLIPTMVLSACFGVLLFAALVAASRGEVRRCANCDHYAYYDGPLCGLRFLEDIPEQEIWLCQVRKAPDDWFCAEWEARR